MQDEVVYERTKLFEEVWSEPVSKVAPRYGVSDVALAKMCRRLKIPLPGRGYWARVAAGRPPKRGTLPPLKKGEDSEVRAARWQPWSAAVRALPAPAQLPSSDARLEVPPDVPAPHALVARAAKLLEKCVVKDGVIQTPESACLAIVVARASLARALRIMHVVVTELERVGWSIVLEPGVPEVCDRHGYTVNRGKPGGTYAAREGERVGFRIVEITENSTKRLPRPDWAAPKKEREAYYASLKPTYVGTGKLSLEIVDAPYGGRSTQRRWRDGETQHVEQRLDAFVRALAVTADDAKALRLEREEAERNRADEERRRKLEEQRRIEEEKRVERLRLQVREWNIAKDVRAFITEAREVAAEFDGPAEGGELETWLAWCEQYADRIDPITPLRRKAVEHRRSR